jgi:putative transposase
MCNVLNIPKSTYYYHENAREKKELKAEEADIKRIFKESRNNYDTRKIKIELKKQMRKVVPRRRIGWIMKPLGLVSKTTP